MIPRMLKFTDFGNLQVETVKTVRQKSPLLTEQHVKVKKKTVCVTASQEQGVKDVKINCTYLR